MEPSQQRPRRFRFRISTLMFLVVIAALLLANLVQMVTAERQTRLAEQARLDAMAARRQAEASLQRAAAALDQLYAQAGREPAKSNPVPSDGIQGAQPK
jgi:hypothetical protein